MATTQNDQRADASTRRHTAGALDIRTIIAMLIGIYGVVLVLTGLVGTSDAELQRSGGMNINLIAGVAMVVVALLFVLWARLRPVVVPEDVEQETAERDEETPARG